VRMSWNLRVELPTLRTRTCTGASKAAARTETLSSRYEEIANVKY